MSRLGYSGFHTHGVCAELVFSISFKYFLPMSARSPAILGCWLSIVRGLVSYWSDSDWRTILHKDTTLKDRLFESYQLISNSSDVSGLVRARYIAQAKEERLSEQIGIYGVKKVISRIEMEGIDQIIQGTEKGTIFATIHFAESTIGSCFLEQIANSVLVMKGDFVESDAVPAWFSRHYKSKYRAMNEQLAAGECLPVEAGLLPFARHLSTGGAIALTVDIPGDTETGVLENFMGCDQLFAGAMRRLQKMTHSQVIPYVAQLDGSVLKFQFGPKNEPYPFFEKVIKKQPHNWWAADLLPLSIDQGRKYIEMSVTGTNQSGG